MAITIDWKHGDGTTSIIDPSGTNNTIGFYGSVFGLSVKVGEYQDATHVTNQAGTINSGVLVNNKYLTSATVETNNDVSGPLTGVVCASGTVRIHFNNSSDAVRLQSTEFRAFDGSDISASPSGVTVQGFELSTTTSGVVDVADATGLNSNGDSTWENIGGTTALDLLTHTFSDNDHYHYIGLSASPDDVGQKSLGFFYQTEFL